MPYRSRDDSTPHKRPIAPGDTPDLTAPHLSKSRYLAALQCDRRLWLAAHAPEQATPLGDADRHILRMGTEVGRAAHALFADGVLVEATAGDHAGAIRQTRSLMLDESVPAIFEAAFEHEGVRICVDILERLGAGRGAGRGAAAEAGGGAGRANNRWGLREVKSSSKVKRLATSIS